MYETNWGEQLSSVVSPVPVVTDLDTEEVTVIDLSNSGDVSGDIHAYIITSRYIAFTVEMLNFHNRIDMVNF